MKVPAVPGLEKPRKNEPYEVWPYRPWPHRDFSKTKSRDFFFFFLRKSRSGVELSGMLVSTASPWGTGRPHARDRPVSADMQRRGRAVPSGIRRQSEAFSLAE